MPGGGGGEEPPEKRGTGRPQILTRGDAALLKVITCISEIGKEHHNLGCLVRGLIWKSAGNKRRDLPDLFRRGKREFLTKSETGPGRKT